MIARFLPLVGIVLFLGVPFVWRAWLQYRRYGSSGIIVFRSARWTHRLRDAVFLVLLVVATVQVIVGAASPQSLSGLYLAPYPLNATWLVLGGLLLFGGILVMVVAQLQLGASWRIGIEEGASPGLVTSGIYRFCRNPIFLGIFIGLIGLVTLLPTWISAAVLVGSFTCVRSQTLAEEAYLLRTYGDAFQSYASRVGRYLPGLGLLKRPDGLSGVSGQT